MAQATLRSDLKASLIDAAAYGGMVGCGETYLAAFALAMGLGETVAGLVTSLPLVAGGLMQLVSPEAVRRIGSYRKWVVFCALVQALTFVPLVIAAILGELNTGTIMVVAAVYWGFGLATGPAWNTWIGALVPPPIRPRFFAGRTRVSQLVVFVGILAAGLLLHSVDDGRSLRWAFGTLFFFACVFRLVSTGALWCQSEPQNLAACMEPIPWRRVYHHIRSFGGGRLLFYLLAVQAAVQISGPFFTPFMLVKLELSYRELVTLFSISYVSKIVSLPMWGRVAKSIGPRRLLWIGGLGIVPISGGWLVSQHLAWLGFMQMCSGVAWAAYELAFFLMFFESIPQNERTSVLTIHNLLNSVAWVIGSTIGATILVSFGKSFDSYLILFGLSSLLRLTTIVLLLRVPDLKVSDTKVEVRTVAVRPGIATVNTPVLSSLGNMESSQAKSDGRINVQ
jgi:MFS family permease